MHAQINLLERFEERGVLLSYFKKFEKEKIRLHSQHLLNPREMIYYKLTTLLLFCAKS
jgi:hypothetical protein